MGRLTLVIQHDSQDRNLIPLRNPVHGARDGKEIRPIPHDLAHELPLVGAACDVVGGELATQRSAAGPTQPLVRAEYAENAKMARLHTSKTTLVHFSYVFECFRDFWKISKKN